jgi:hypothetical protein
LYLAFIIIIITQIQNIFLVVLRFKLVYLVHLKALFTLGFILLLYTTEWSYNLFLYIPTLWTFFGRSYLDRQNRPLSDITLKFS